MGLSQYLLELEHMITDQETNFVYFSKYLSQKKTYHSFFRKLTVILDRYDIGYDLLPYTNKNDNDLLV